MAVAKRRGQRRAIVALAQAGGHHASDVAGRHGVPLDQASRSGQLSADGKEKRG
jgi:hypothetical protein